MKAVIQRVSSASVCVDGKIVGAIAKGLLVFLGITHDDTQKECRWMAEKIATLRIFTDECGKMNLSCADCQGQVLVVSQFTLYANALSGRRPDFVQAARPESAEPLYNAFVGYLEQILEQPIATGIFGAMMQVELVNDGPVTLIIESVKKL